MGCKCKEKKTPQPIRTPNTVKTSEPNTKLTPEEAALIKKIAEQVKK